MRHESFYDDRCQLKKYRCIVTLEILFNNGYNTFVSYFYFFGQLNKTGNHVRYTFNTTITHFIHTTCQCIDLQCLIIQYQDDRALEPFEISRYVRGCYKSVRYCRQRFVMWMLKSAVVVLTRLRKNSEFWELVFYTIVPETNQRKLETY